MATGYQYLQVHGPTINQLLVFSIVCGNQTVIETGVELQHLLAMINYVGLRGTNPTVLESTLLHKYETI
jgi:hypothetical protein